MAQVSRGAKFAAAVRAKFELSIAEELVLSEIADTIDAIDSLPKNGTAARMQRVILVRLLGVLNLPADDGAPALMSPTSLRGKRAADVRWRRERAANS